MSENMRSLLVGLALVFGVAAFFGQPPAKADSYTEQIGTVGAGRSLRLTNVSAPGANTDIIDSVDGEESITWQSSDPARVTVTLATSSVFNLMLTPSGESEVALQLNESALAAGVEYTFDVYGLREGDVFDFEVETDSAVSKISVGRLKKD